MNKREFLRSQGFTVGDRGRFSADMLAAIAAAPAGTITEDEKPAKVVKVAKVKQPAEPKVAQPEVNPKEVRAWAKANGHDIPERGRIKQEVVAAFLAAGGKAVGERAKRPTPLDMPRRRAQNTGYSVVKNILIRQENCGSCKARVGYCNCATGPQAHAFLSKEVGSPVLLTLDKPSL